MRTGKRGQLIREKGDKTIKFSELQRLSFCNSKKLPGLVIAGGQLRMWVGFGWIEVDNKKAKKSTPFVVE